MNRYAGGSRGVMEAYKVVGPLLTEEGLDGDVVGKPVEIVWLAEGVVVTAVVSDEGEQVVQEAPRAACLIECT